jgi:hypothetical protein
MDMRRNRVAHIKSAVKLALASALLMTFAACSGTGFPVALTGSGSNNNSSSGSGSGPGGSVTAGQGTTVCGSGKTFQQCPSLPVAGATYNNTVPIAVMATSPYGITGWQAYVDGNLVTSSASGQGTTGQDTGNWNATVPGIAPGSHLVAVNTWDNDAADGYTPLSYAAQVNVVGSPLPTPAATATVYSNLQAASGSSGSWQICNGSCSGSSGTGSSAIVQAATNGPTLSGASMEEISTGAAFNTLGYLKPPCPAAGCTSVTNFLDDVWFYIPSTTSALQALEFDPDAYDGSYEYFLSMQCDSVSGDWRFWNMNTATWTTQGGSAQVSTYPCQLLTKTNQWHHFQLYGTMNYSAHIYTYETFVVDGTTVFQNLGNSYPARPYTSGPSLIVEQQIDNNATATSNSVYYDDYNLTVW